MNRRLRIVIGWFLLISTNAFAADFTGPVVSVLDGDTIEVLHKRHPECIRLSGIDCPEKGQAFRQKPKQAASALVFGKDVTLHTYGKDKDGRTITACEGLDLKWRQESPSTGTLLSSLSSSARTIAGIL
jgi:endonuclease YncB( thermonuclease family)